jgi:hypothetical protein
MLNKIKKYLLAAIAVIGLVVAAYFGGKSKGKQDEKLKNIEKVQKNVISAARARSLLGNSGFVRRLRRKYGRV